MRSPRITAWLVLGTICVGCVRNPDPAARRAAALVAIAERGWVAAAQAPRVVADLSDPALVDLAIWALGELGPDAAPTAVPPLLDLEVASNPLRHAAVCVALGQLRDRRQAVHDYLVAATTSPFVIVRQAARGAM